MLVGRDAEQSAVARLLAGARLGHSGALVLTGEAGIGKTAVLDHAQAQAEGMLVLRAAGSEAERNVAFGGLLQLLRPLLRQLDRIPEPQAEALGVALSLRDGKTSERFAVGAATLSLLSRAAEEQPLLLLVDDAHALDRPSAEALVFVARRLVADRLAVLAATCEEPARGRRRPWRRDAADQGLRPPARASSPRWVARPAGHPGVTRQLGPSVAASLKEAAVGG